MIKEILKMPLGCTCGLAVLLLNLTIGGFSFDYCLWYIFEKNIPWYADAICGLFLGELTIPGMIVCWIMKLCGVAGPLVG